VDPKERLSFHPPWRGEPGAPAYGLHEANTVVPHLGIGPQDLEGNAWHDHVLRPEAERRRTDETVALLAPARGLAVLEVDPGLQVVGLAEAVGIAQPLEIPSSSRPGGGSS